VSLPLGSKLGRVLRHASAYGTPSNISDPRKNRCHQCLRALVVALDLGETARDVYKASAPSRVGSRGRPKSCTAIRSVCVGTVASLDLRRERRRESGDGGT
jgi:hypothetical protein